MMKTTYITALLWLASVVSTSGVWAGAQTPDTTPRQNFIAFISETPVPALKFKPLGDTPSDPVLGYKIPAPEEVAIEPPAQEVVLPKAAQPAGELSDEASLNPPAAAAEPPLPKTLPQKPAASERLPFYVTAADYLAARKSKDERIALTYSVRAANAKSGLAVPARSVTVLIGPDYAASIRDDEIRIYDFRTARLLTVRTTDGAAEFDNISLYAAAYKNVDTVNRATRAGALKSIKIGPDLTLDSFWLEASLGWTARTEFENLNAERNNSDVKAVYDGETILTLDLSGPEMPSEAHMRSLFAFWHHDASIHPAILPEIGRPERAPKSLVVTSYSPNVPGGLVTTWTLTEARTERADFPLPSTAKNVLEKDTVSPLAFVISRAAKGYAMADRMSADQLRDDIHAQKEAGTDFEAWLSGKILAERLGGCDQDPALLCEDLEALEKNAKADSDLAKLPKILAETQDEKARAKAFEALIPYIKGEIAPAFLVKIAGQTRSRIKSKDMTPEVRAYRADRLLEEALAKNPYDPEIYQSLAQVYAADGRFAESWDIYDAMRALPDVTEALSAPINRAEASIKTRAPGFFAPLIP